MISIRHLQIFITVADQGNMTRASEILHMTQPAVSRTIHDIESEYNVLLFDRINHRLCITQAGMQFYRQAVNIVDSFGKMQESLEKWDTSGILRIGSCFTFGETLLPDIVPVMKERYPDMKLEIIIGSGELIYEKLQKNQIDIALLEGIPEHMGSDKEEFSFLSLAPDKLILILPPDHPLSQHDTISLQDIAASPFLLRGTVEQHSILIWNAFEKEGLSVHPLWKSDDIHAIIRAVHNGVGLSILPESVVREEILSGYLVTRPIRDISLERMNYLIWYKGKFLNQAAREFISLCHDK